MMNRPQRIVLDNNIVLSRMISSRGIAAMVFDLAYDSCILLTSELVLEELRDVAQRPKFERYLDSASRREFIARYELAAKRISSKKSVEDCRDPNDNRFLELALSGHADIIVTGDNDLLALHPWRGISILTPRTYLNSIR